jgi:adenylate kinase family enzyme
LRRFDSTHFFDIIFPGTQFFVLKFKNKGGKMRFESVILLIGRPGSGKNTVGELLDTCYHYSHVICSDVLGDDEEIIRIKRAGGYVSDEIVLQKISEHLHQNQKLGPLLVLNGAPRTEAQAVGIVDILQHQFCTGARIATFDVFATKAQSRRRQATRSEERTDKAPAIVQERDKMYEENEKAVRGYLARYTRLYPINNSSSLKFTETDVRVAMGKEQSILRDRCPKTQPNFAAHVEAIHNL